jgi:hypothetical protein
MLTLACAMGILPGAALAREGFGRLFFTPAQREQLDHARRQPIEPDAVGDADRQPAPPYAQSMAIEGIVRRSDGQATVWINRTPTPVPAPGPDMRIGPVGDAGDGADLRLPHGDRRVRVKVGQEVDLRSGQVRERYRQPLPGHAVRAEPAIEADPDASAPATTPGHARGEQQLHEPGRRFDDAPRSAGSAR